jgi:hypothetical protein
LLLHCSSLIGSLTVRNSEEITMSGPLQEIFFLAHGEDRAFIGRMKAIDPAVAAILKAQGLLGREILDYVSVKTESALVGVIKEAKKRKWFMEIADLPSDVRAKALEVIKNHDLATHLRTKLGSNALRSIVCCRGEDSRNACAFRAAIETTADFQGKTIGMSWGMSAALFAEYACRPGSNHRLAGNFVPICGDPLGAPSPNPAFTSSAIAVRMNTAAQSSERRSLSGVPAFFPPGLNPDHLRECRKGFPTVVKKLDGLVTGIGHSALGYDADLLVERAEFERLKVDRVALGDLAGALIPRDRLNDLQQVYLDNANLRWTGLSVGDLEEIAGRSPGVIVIAPGIEKKDVLIECIKRNLVTHAFVSSPLFNSLMADFPASLGRRQAIAMKKQSTYDTIV